MKRFWGMVSVFLIILLVTLPAVASERIFVPVAADGQEVEYDDGDETLTTGTGKAFIAVSFLPESKKSCFIKIELRNIGETSFTLRETDIAASSGQDALVIMTYAERVKEQKRAEMWANVAMGMSAMADGYNAGSAGYGESSGTFTASGNGKKVEGSYSSSYYDSSAAYQAQADAQSRSMQMQERQAANAKFARRELKDRAFRTNTLSPGEWMVGDVKVALPKKNKKDPPELVVTLSVAGEPVQFRFREKL